MLSIEGIVGLAFGSMRLADVEQADRLVGWNSRSFDSI